MTEPKLKLSRFRKTPPPPHAEELSVEDQAREFCRLVGVPNDAPTLAALLINDEAPHLRMAFELFNAALQVGRREAGIFYAGGDDAVDLGTWPYFRETIQDLHTRLNSTRERRRRCIGALENGLLLARERKELRGEWAELVLEELARHEAAFAKLDAPSAKREILSFFSEPSVSSTLIAARLAVSVGAFADCTIRESKKAFDSAFLPAPPKKKGT